MVKIDELLSSGFIDCIEAFDVLSAKKRRSHEYFSNIIEDIETPMNAVLGFLELLKREEADPHKVEYIDTALKSGESMVALIGDALDISKMSSSKMNIEKSDFSVLEELSDAAKLFYNSAKKKDITLSAYYDPNIPKMINSDRYRIKQIMNNLLNNAIKFTPNGGLIELDLIYDEQIDALTVSIKDNGIGIAEDMQESIFTPYTQEKNSTSREYGGTGLGLSISQQLSALLGGKMELESKYGDGSRFYFTIPCYTAEGKEASIDKSPLRGLSAIIYSPKKSNITLNIAKRYFDSFGIDATSIRDKSITKIKEIDFDIMLIQKEDTIGIEEDIQEILDTDKLVIILEKKYLDDHNWFVGKTVQINSPLFPNEIYDAAMQLVSAEENEENIKESLEVYDSTIDTMEEIKNRHILVVDNNAINLKFIKEILNIFGINSVLANSKEEAIEKFLVKNFDMVLIDESVQKEKGRNITSLIRMIESNKDMASTTIIELSSDTNIGDRDKPISTGVNSVLIKPIQFDSIRDTIIKYM